MTRTAEPRSAALDILRRTSTGSTMELALTESLEGLAPRDRHLAHEIASGVLRNRRVLDLRIDGVLTKPDGDLARRLRDILRIGVYQILFLDRVPDYAAVTATVDLARQAGGKAAAGLANAVLRRIAQHGLLDLGDRRPAVRLSHPDWLYQRWRDRWGEERTEQLMEHNNQVAPVVIQPTVWTLQEIEAALTAAGIEHGRHPSGLGIVVRHSLIAEIPGFNEGAFIVQDPAQRLLLGHADVPAHVRVWDACAAPGGKAIMLSRDRRVVVSDRSQPRMARVLENARRTGVDLLPLIADAGAPPIAATSFDAVIVDAPCSATGTMRRHPDARWSLSPNKIRKAAAGQERILTAVADAVEVGGLLVYLTCSLEREENEDQVNRFLQSRSDYERTRPDLFVFPPDQETDGGYGARLRRVK